MGLLKPATNQTAYAKLGIMGFAGGGKTLTATKIAIGLTKTSKAKQIAFFDTEKGSDFIQPKIVAAGLELVTHRGRAFRDLVLVIKEAQEAKIPVLIIDSITHIWRDLVDSYSSKYKKRSLAMYDWGILKAQWKEFTDLYVNSSLHIIMCGRAGYEYEQGVNEDTGKKEINKSGTKMKVEGETGFEPDLLLEMDRVHEQEKIINRCWVIKDRSDTMNGKSIDMPDFKDFNSFWKTINFGETHQGFDSNRTSEDLFDDPDWSHAEIVKRREIALEELQAVLIKAGLDGTSTEAKKGRVALLEETYGTSAKTALESLSPKILNEGLDKIKLKLGFKKPVAEPTPEPEAVQAQELEEVIAL